MDTAVVANKKLKPEEVTESFCEMHGLSSRTAAACREELIKCEPNTFSGERRIYAYLSYIGIDLILLID